MQKLKVKKSIEYFGNCPNCNEFITTDGITNTLLIQNNYGKCMFCKTLLKIEY